MKMRFLIIAFVFVIICIPNEVSAQWSVMIKGGVKLFSPARNSYKLAKPLYKLPKSTVKHLPSSSLAKPYTQLLPKTTDNLAYPSNLNRFIDDNSLLYQRQNYTDAIHYMERRSANAQSVIPAYHRKRIATAQQHLKENGYYDDLITGEWDDKTQKALIDYHASFEAQLKSIANPDLRQQAIVKFNSEVPEELLSRAFNQNKAYREFINNHTFERITAMQSNLKKLGYYTGEVNGIYDPLSHQAVRKFEKDFGLTKMSYDFKYVNDPKLMHVELDQGDDFIRYWTDKSKSIKSDCSPTLCLSNSNITISVDCGPVSLAISSKAEITLSATNGRRTYEYVYNQSVNEVTSPTCVMSWKLCLSQSPQASISICDVSISGSSSGQVKLSSKDAGGNSVRIF